ncbi:hypothetical protein LJC59_09295, partial [Desulfovibrio sp. OttesenSCG-928-A18]|nr:hypothetical protein [Desulfovibrio sp. OttesenSCG-928-A18]
MPNSEKVQLVALADGFFPFADPLDCDDLRGPRSLFGESFGVPQPAGEWRPAGSETRDPDDYAPGHILWESPAGFSRTEIARRIAASGVDIAGKDSDLPLGVPVQTYICGRASSSFAPAWKLYEDGLLPEWGAVICSCQTEGYGQLRRPWHSPRGNLYVSFRLPDDPLFSGDAAALVTGYILLLSLRSLGFPVQLKWPNDLLLDGAGKVGGILLEERKGATIAGLGLNLREAPHAALLHEHSATPAAVLLPGHGRGAYDGAAPERRGFFEKTPRPEQGPCGALAEPDEVLAPFVIWRQLVSGAVLAYSHCVEGRPLPQILGDLEQYLAWKGCPVKLLEADRTAPRTGFFIGLGPKGGLLLREGREAADEYLSGSLC